MSTAPHLGVLLSNLGTPDDPSPGAIRRFLHEFLSDPEVIRVPRWIWLPILHGFILRVRPARVAAAYRAIWTEGGSPLLWHSRRQEQALQGVLEARRPAAPVTVALGMRYGRPSIVDALVALRRAGAEALVVLPLYPQRSETTSGSTEAAVRRELARGRWALTPRFVEGYHLYPAYVEALAQSVREHWAARGRAERLLLSFHGLPKRYCDEGDPYAVQCHATAQRLAQRLGCRDREWAIGFQSRVGRSEWLRPYTDELLVAWGRRGVGHVQVLCPGFAADCLETLEEIAIGEAVRFREAGGRRLEYIPALNDRPGHVAALAGLVLEHARECPPAAPACASHKPSGATWPRNDGTARGPGP